MIIVTWNPTEFVVAPVSAVTSFSAVMMMIRGSTRDQWYVTQLAVGGRMAMCNGLRKVEKVHARAMIIYCSFVPRRI